MDEINNRLEIKLGSLILRNPLLTAAGCSGHSNELKVLKDFNFSSLGAFVTKGVTLEEKRGNSSPRIVEITGGIINSIGLQNNGLAYFMSKELPKLKRYNVPIIVNVAANSINDFEDFCVKMVRYRNSRLIDGIEVNVSCPNVAAGGMSLGVNPLDVELIIHSVKNIIPDKLIITKLTPNVTDIVELAEAAIQGGTDALCMINTVRGCAVDIENKKFVLERKFGGISGPCIKPIGLLAVHECFSKIEKCKNKEIPIIGVGGILEYKDVLEYIHLGASAVQIGTGFLNDPGIFKEILFNLETYCDKKKKNISELIGIIN